MQISSLRPTKQVLVFDSIHSAAISPANVAENCSGPTNVVPCAICHERRSIYSCPRCRIPYCSVSCYQKHGAEVVRRDDGFDNNDGLGCTEQFYENRVSQVLNLEVKGNSKYMHHKLRDAISNQLKDESNELDASVESKCNHDRMNRDELLQLLSVLENFEETNDRDSGMIDDEVLRLNELLKQNCSVKVHKLVHETMSKFANDTGDGETKDLGTVIEWILEPWKPWWRPDIQPVIRDECGDNDSIEDDENDDCNIQSHSDVIQTIDERVLALPRFDSLFRMKHCIDDTSNLDQFPKLQYNLVDVLLSTAFTLRLYCGVSNVLHQNLAFDAVSTFIGASNVLLNDIRHGSLESVLLDCSNTNHPTQKLLRMDRSKSANPSTCISNQNVSISWTLLVQDVAMMLQNFRLVMRALFEANDIVIGAISETRSFLKSSKAGDARTTLGEQRKQLSRIHKKIEFYLSWCAAIRKACHGAWPLTRMSSDILLWLDAWSLPTKGEDVG